jgi:hypothetical protein
VSAILRWTGDGPDMDRTVHIDGCHHMWGPLVGDRRRCRGRCGVLLIGTLATIPPACGIDWSRAVLVNPCMPAGRSGR